MRIHEFQARQLLAGAKIPVPASSMVTTADAAFSAAQLLVSAGSRMVVVKAQVHAGGRGKA